MVENVYNDENETINPYSPTLEILQPSFVTPFALHILILKNSSSCDHHYTSRYWSPFPISTFTHANASVQSSQYDCLWVERPQNGRTALQVIISKGSSKEQPAVLI